MKNDRDRIRALLYHSKPSPGKIKVVPSKKLRYSPVEFAAISPFKLFAPQQSFSNGTLELASPIELMETKFLKWLGKDRGLGLYFDEQLVTSYSNVCVISSEDGVTENCHENFDETKEGDSYVKVIFID